MRLYGVAPGRRAVVASAERARLRGRARPARRRRRGRGDRRSAPRDAGQSRRRCGAGSRRRGPPRARRSPRRSATAASPACASPKSPDKAPDEPNGQRIDCDCVVTSVGYAPAGNLVCYAGGRFAYDEDTAMHRVVELPPGVVPAGSVNGVWDLDAVLADGRRAGWHAARVLGRTKGEPPPAPPDALASQITHPWPIFPHPKGKDFVDFDEDLEVKDISKRGAGRLRRRPAAQALLHARHGAEPGPALERRRDPPARARPPAGASRRSARPRRGRPTSPEKFAHLAGRGFDPVRHTAMHHRHLELGARMMVAGAWLRPAYYGAKEDAEALIAAEVRAVPRQRRPDRRVDARRPRHPRAGRRRVRGAHVHLGLPQAAGRPGALRADVRRDGRDHRRRRRVPPARAALLRHRDHRRRRCGLPPDAVVERAVAARRRHRQRHRGLCGRQPRGPAAAARCWPGSATTSISSPAAFPYMGVRTGHVAGIPVRLLRVGFVGELGYEIHAPASLGEALWDALMAAGAPFGIRPFGVEAQRVLRLEKGHIIVGQDTDGLTHPYEAGDGLGDRQEQAVLRRQAVDRDPAGARRAAHARRLHAARSRTPCARRNATS